MENRRRNIEYEYEHPHRPERRRWLMMLSGAITGGSWGIFGGPGIATLGLVVGASVGYLLDRFIKNSPSKH